MFLLHIRGTVLAPGNHLFHFPYGTFALFGLSFQRNSGHELRCTPVHISTLFPKRIRVALCRLRSLLLAASLRFLFLRLLGCFDSAGSLSLTGMLSEDNAIRIQSPRVLRTHAPPPGISLLTATFVDAKAELSPSRPKQQCLMSRPKTLLFHRDPPR